MNQSKGTLPLAANPAPAGSGVLPGYASQAFGHAPS